MRPLLLPCALIAMLCACKGDRPSVPDDAGIDAAIVPDPRPPVLPTCGRGGACDLIAQDCGADQACVLDERGAALCVARGVASDGIECRGHDQCRPGLICDSDASGTGVCRRLCCPGATGGCTIDASCVGLDGTDVGVCVPDSRCRPPAIGCADGDACYVVSGAGHVSCLPAGSLEAGAACQQVGDCAPGLACLKAAGGPATCVRMCDPQNSAGCADGERCGLLPSGRGAVCEPG